jgi:hypothetical protein
MAWARDGIIDRERLCTTGPAEAAHEFLQVWHDPQPGAQQGHSRHVGDRKGAPLGPEGPSAIRDAEARPRAKVGIHATT